MKILSIDDYDILVTVDVSLSDELLHDLNYFAFNELNRLSHRWKRILQRYFLNYGSLVIYERLLIEGFKPRNECRSTSSHHPDM